MKSSRELLFRVRTYCRRCAGKVEPATGMHSDPEFPATVHWSCRISGRPYLGSYRHHVHQTRLAIDRLPWSKPLFLHRQDLIAALLFTNGSDTRRVSPIRRTLVLTTVILFVSLRSQAPSSRYLTHAISLLLDTDTGSCLHRVGS
jgi:hypothetical protein